MTRRLRPPVSLTVLVALALLSAGCERKLHYEPIPVDGFLKTPHGQFEFEHITEMEDAQSVQHRLRGTPDSKRHGYIVAHAPHRAA